MVGYAASSKPTIAIPVPAGTTEPPVTVEVSPQPVSLPSMTASAVETVETLQLRFKALELQLKAAESSEEARDIMKEMGAITDQVKIAKLNTDEVI